MMPFVIPENFDETLERLKDVIENPEGDSGEICSCAHNYFRLANFGYTLRILEDPRKPKATPETYVNLIGLFDRAMVVLDETHKDFERQRIHSLIKLARDRGRDDLVNALCDRPDLAHYVVGAVA